MAQSLSVQNRAAAAGVTRKAMTRISPTACSPATVARVTRASIAMSRAATGHPCEAAKPESKHSSRNSLKRRVQSSRTAAADAAITRKSSRTMEAALP